MSLENNVRIKMYDSKYSKTRNISSRKSLTGNKKNMRHLYALYLCV